ncbi:LysR family transcriptional regulator, partial [Angustibacter aerolatus]
MLDVLALRTVRAIAEHGGFTGAAAALGTTQPAVSQLVRRLEARLGTVLVERSGRTVRLTEAGQVLARHAVTALAAVETAGEEVAAIAGLRAGRVRVSAFPSWSASVLPRAFADVRRRHPGLVLGFTEAEPPEALEALRAGRCDVAVVFDYPGSGTTDDVHDLRSTHLLDDEVQVVLPGGHAAAADRVALADLADEEWIAGCPRCRQHLLVLAGRAGFAPRVAFETDDAVAVQGLVAAGLGVALLPALSLQATRRPDVEVRAVQPAARRTVTALTRPDLRRVPAVAAMLDALVAALA